VDHHGALVDHHSLLRTVEDAWDLPELTFKSDHAQVAAMDEFLSP
jgi:hypothetical protein